MNGHMVNISYGELRRLDGKTIAFQVIVTNEKVMSKVLAQNNNARKRAGDMTRIGMIFY